MIHTDARYFAPSSDEEESESEDEEEEDKAEEKEKDKRIDFKSLF